MRTTSRALATAGRKIVGLPASAALKRFKGAFAVVFPPKNFFRQTAHFDAEIFMAIEAGRRRS